MARLPDYSEITNTADDDSLWIWDKSIAQLKRVEVADLRAALGLPGDYLHMRRTGSFVVSANVWSTVAWTAVAESAGVFSSNGPSTSIAIPRAGYYECAFSCDVNPSSGARQIDWRFAVNGDSPAGWSVVSVVATSASMQVVGKARFLNQGDTLGAQVRCIGASAACNFIHSAGFSLVRVS
jgi:hypothetical protein